MTKRPRREPGAKTRGLTREAFPALRAFVRGYLHQDFEEVHGSLRAAADAFRADASPAEREQLVQELVSLTALVADLPARLLRQFIEELGGGWMPKSKEEIAELLEAMRAR
jgi:thermostable 8-oxoguanine DNA glycosylase